MPYVAENTYLKQIEPRFPMVILGIVALIGAYVSITSLKKHMYSPSEWIIHLNKNFSSFPYRFLVSFLPETTNHKLPDTIAEGEQLGKGDTFYTSICRSKNIRRKEKYEVNGVV